jgi:hypothetical protein
MKAKTEEKRGEKTMADSTHTEKTTETHDDAKPAKDVKTTETHDDAKPAKDVKTTETRES